MFNLRVLPHRVKLIEFATEYYTIYPGDVMFTGSPPGVSEVKPGDEMHCACDALRALGRSWLVGPGDVGVGRHLGDMGGIIDRRGHDLRRARDRRQEGDFRYRLPGAWAAACSILVRHWGRAAITASPRMS